MLIESRELYDIYRITLKTVERLCGGTPKSPDLIKVWVESSTGFSDAKSEELTAEALEAMKDQKAENGWIGFRSDADGIYIEARQVKAMFKECASLLRIFSDKLGSKQILQHGFEIKSMNGTPSRIHFGKKEPDGWEEHAIHVTTAQGPRTSIKRIDYVEPGVEIVFEVWVLKTAPAEKRHVGEKELRRMLALAQENGLGADRSQGKGKHEVVGFDKIQ